MGNIEKNIIHFHENHYKNNNNNNNNNDRHEDIFNTIFCSNEWKKHDHDFQYHTCPSTNNNNNNNNNYDNVRVEKINHLLTLSIRPSFQNRLIHGKGMERKIIFDLRKNKIIRIKPFKQNIYQKIIQLEERKEEFLTLDTIKQICRNSKYYYNNMNRKNGINVKVSKINKYIY